LRGLRARFAIAMLLAAGASLSSAHEGHDHGSPQPETPAHVAPRGEAISDYFELVAVASGKELVIYLDSFDSNAPVEGASIEVETPDGVATAAERAGVYRLDAPWLRREAKVDLIFSVAAGGLSDILPLTLIAPGAIARPAISSIADRIAAVVQPALMIAAFAGFALGIAVMMLKRRGRSISALIPAVVLTLYALEGRADGDHARPNPDAATAPLIGERAQRLPDGRLFVPKAVQRIFDVRTVRTEVAVHRRAVELPGRIIADPNSSGFVQAAVGGRLSAPEGGFPRLGAQVKKDQVLAYVTPPMQAIDVSDMRQRQGELDQQIEIVGRRVARFERLAPSGAVAATQLEDAKLELQGLKDRRNALDKARREPEALLAPVSGVIAEGTPVAGQMAQPNAVIFHIVDPRKLWIEALSFDPLSGAETAAAKTASGRLLSLSYRGAGFADRNPSIPVHFAIEGDVSDLRAGQLVTVIVQTSDETQGIAVPRTSVVRSANGQDFIYVHVSAERFEPRAVRVEPLDGDRVLVLAGIEKGERIVTQGAELLDHVR
jgi:hypothetical protein